MLSILYGLFSALSWGSGDFAGGLASRKLGAYRAVFYADVLGLLIILPVLAIYREPLPSSAVLLNASIGGALGSFGLLVLYYSLTVGKMSIAAPVSALFAALLPVVVGLFAQGLPTPYQLAGFGFALAAVWLTSQGHSDDGIATQLKDLAKLRLPILAGIGFGCYFIFVHYASHENDAVIWTMIASRVAGTLLLWIVLLARRESFTVPREAWLVVFLNATLDLAGNFFYILASQAGRLDVSAVLSSLYPGSTIILAWIILKERITRMQGLGILLTLTAIFLFTV
ncbi:MAG TPA: DMT family transporter [Anaerolineales bacterium]|nr:DMT family transporter [Anaerolineales bacterium]